LLLIGATDYLGAIILLRSIFELLIGTATTVNGSMRDRISSIEKFDDNEKSSLQNFWNGPEGSGPEGSGPEGSRARGVKGQRGQVYC